MRAELLDAYLVESRMRRDYQVSFDHDGGNEQNSRARLSAVLEVSVSDAFVVDVMLDAQRGVAHDQRPRR